MDSWPAPRAVASSHSAKAYSHWPPAHFPDPWTCHAANRPHPVAGTRRPRAVSERPPHSASELRRCVASDRRASGLRGSVLRGFRSPVLRSPVLRSPVVRGVGSPCFGAPARYRASPCLGPRVASGPTVPRASPSSGPAVPRASPSSGAVVLELRRPRLVAVRDRRTGASQRRRRLARRRRPCPRAAGRPAAAASPGWRGNCHVGVAARLTGVPTPAGYCATAQDLAKYQFSGSISRYGFCGVTPRRSFSISVI
jgi:hypothetical protein